MSKQSMVLFFEDTPLKIVDRNGVPWVTARELAKALGYAQEQNIHRLFEKNAEEFNEDMVGVVETTTPGGTQKTRVFSPRGCYAMGFFARTKRAAAFRRWVLDVLEHRTYDAPLIQHEKYWFARRPLWPQIRTLAYEGLRNVDIAPRVNRSPSSVGNSIRRMVEVGLMDPARRYRARYSARTAQRLVHEQQLCLDWGRAA